MIYFSPLLFKDYGWIFQYEANFVFPLNLEFKSKIAMLLSIARQLMSLFRFPHVYGHPLNRDILPCLILGHVVSYHECFVFILFFWGVCDFLFFF